MARRRVISPDDAGPTTSDRASAPVSRTRRHVQDTWEIVSEVLLGMAAGKVMEFVGDVVPGSPTNSIAATRVPSTVSPGPASKELHHDDISHHAAAIDCGAQRGSLA